MVKSTLEGIEGLGLVEVSGGSVVDAEAGRSWVVTFLSAPGDVPELVPETTQLSGVGAVVTVAERVKGTEAVGNAIRLSYAAPLACSSSEVVPGECGAPVTHVRMELDTAPSFTAQPLIRDIPVDYRVQSVRLSSAAL